MEKGPEEEDGILTKEGTNPIHPSDPQLPALASTAAVGGDSAVMTAAASKLDPAQVPAAPEGDGSEAEEPVASAPTAGKGKTIVKGPSRIADEGVRPGQPPTDDNAPASHEKSESDGEDSAEEKEADESAEPGAKKGVKGTGGPPPADESEDGSASEDDESGEDEGDERPSHPAANDKEGENEIEVEIDDDEDSDEEEEDGEAGQAVHSSRVGASDQDDPSAQEGPTANDEDGDEDEEQLEIVELEEADSEDEAGEEENDDEEPRQPSAFGGRTTTSQNVGRVLVSQAGVESDDVEDEEDEEGADADEEDEEDVNIEGEYDVAEVDPADEPNASDADPKASDEEEEEENEDGEDQAMYDGDEEDSRQPLAFDNTRDTADTMDDGEDHPGGYEDDEHDDLDDEEEDEEVGDVSLVPVEAAQDKYEDDEEEGVEQNDANVIDEKDPDEAEGVDEQGVENAGMSDHEQDNIAVYDGNGPFEDDGLEDDDDENDNLSGLDNVLAEDPNGVLPPAEFLSDDVPPEHQHLPPLNVVDEVPNIENVPVLSEDLGDTAQKTIADDNAVQEEGESLKAMALGNLPPSLTGKRSGDALVAEDKKDFVAEEEKDSRKGVPESEMNGIEDHERDRKKARIA